MSGSESSAVAGWGLCVAETNIINGGQAGRDAGIAGGFCGKFANKKTNHIDDPKLLATKQQVLNLFIRRTGGDGVHENASKPIWTNPRPKRCAKCVRRSAI